MFWQWSPSVIAEIAASVCILVLAFYFPWRELNRRARLFMTTLLLACALWMESHAVEIALPAASTKSYLMGLQLIWGTIAITFWWLYIVHHIGSKKWLTGRIYLLLSIMPSILILGTCTNHLHHAIWSRPGLDNINPYLPLQPTYGIVYWIGMAYVSVLTLSGSVLLVKNVIRRHHGRPRESASLLIAAALPLLAALVETLGLSGPLNLSIGMTPWASFIGSLLLIWNLPRFHLRQVIPIARDSVFERMDDGIIVLDKWDRIIDLNPAAERFMGHKIADVLGFSVKEIFPQWPASLGLADQAPASDREIVLDRGGEKRTYQPSVSVLPDPDGRLTSRLVLLTDISHRKQAEGWLRESEEKYRTLFDTMIQGVVYQDAEGKIISANPAAERVLGLTLDQMRGRTSLDPRWKAFHEDGSDFPGETHPAMIALATGKNIHNVVMGVFNPSQEAITWININAVPQFLPGETAPCRVYTTFEDITERRKAEEELEKSRMNLDLAIEASQIGIWELDLASDVSVRNLRHDQIFGYAEKRADWGVRTLLEHIAVEDRPSVQAAMDRAIETDRIFFECRILWPDRSVHWITAIGKIVRDGAGKPQEIFGTVSDITAQKLEIKRIRDALDATVQAMAMTVETRDPYTAGHQRRVSDLARAIAGEMNLPMEMIDGVSVAASIHDLGKISIPVEMLSKPTKLTDIEFMIIKTHAQGGYDILKGIEFPWPVARIVLEHHERMNGSGYPNGSTGDKLLMESRILAVADVVEAMASHRPYRPSLGIGAALQEIEKNQGVLYDSGVVSACVALFREQRFDFK